MTRTRIAVTVALVSAAVAHSAPCPGGFTQMKLTTTAGSVNCGSPAQGTPPSPPVLGRVDGATVKLLDLGAGCLYLGGGGNSGVPPAGIPEGLVLTFEATCAAGSPDPPTNVNLGASKGTGETDCTQGAGNARHCLNSALHPACVSDAECGGAGACALDAKCFFGAPQPVDNAGVKICYLNVIQTDAKGTLDATTGDVVLSLSLLSEIFFDSCPRCRAGTCSGGDRDGFPCTATNAGLTSANCPPPSSNFIASLPVTIPALGTMTSSLPASAPSADGSLCSGQTHPGAFGLSLARRVIEVGSPAGPVSDLGAHALTLASSSCLPATGNPNIDVDNLDLPGPVAIALPGRIQLQATSSTSTTLTTTTAPSTSTTLHCGNGVIEPELGESCEPGAPDSSDRFCCTPSCKVNLVTIGRDCGPERALDVCELRDACDAQGHCAKRVKAQDVTCRDAFTGNNPCDAGDNCDGVNPSCPTTNIDRCRADTQQPQAGVRTVAVKCEAPSIESKSKHRCTARGFVTARRPGGALATAALSSDDTCGGRQITFAATETLKQSTNDTSFLQRTIQLKLNPFGRQLLRKKRVLNVCVRVTVKFRGAALKTTTQLVELRL